MKDAKSIVKAQLIEPFRDKEYGYVGMEFEYPIICMDKEVSLKEIGSAYLRRLTEEYGYREEIKGTDGYYVRVSKDGDSVSFDYTYGMLELSMGKQKTLTELRRRMVPMLRQAQGYYRKYGCLITGMGSRILNNKCVEYTYDPFYVMIRQFVSDYAMEKDLGKYFPNMFSVQTHIDIPYENLLETYNLFNGLDFVRGLLFSNSLGKGEGEETLYCRRDDIWEKCGIPNTGIYDHKFTSLEELAETLCQEKIFVKEEDGELLGMKPESLDDYFAGENASGEDIRFFRSFKRVVLNAYHVLEVRGDCTQPVRDSFVTAAFHVGIAYRYREAAKALEEFLADNQIAASNSELRRMAVRGREIVPKEKMKTFLNGLLAIATEGLVIRGYGEERMLVPLWERVDKFTNPAKELHKALELGIDAKDMIELYGQL